MLYYIKMKKNIKSHIRRSRISRLPEDLRRDLHNARIKLGWSQVKLGERTGLPQMHISGIETGKIVPRYDTLLDLVRVLDFDLLMVPRALVPAVQALVRDYRNPDRETNSSDGERPLYAVDGDEADERR